MAWEYVNCSECGEGYRVQMYGPTKTREWKIENWSGLCDDCKEAEKAALIEENKSGDLPELTGSDKQIAWAMQIRASRIASFEKIKLEELSGELSFQLSQKYSKLDIEEAKVKAAEFREKLGSNPQAFFAAAAEQAFAETSAHKWIDHREKRTLSMIGESAVALLEENYKFIESDLEAEAKAEAVICPSEPKTETIADIRQLDDRIEISFKESNGDFKEIIKALGYRWESPWTKKLSFKTESVEDRVAEVGHAILAGGFPARVMNPGIRKKILSGDFTPEHTRWISVLIKKPDLFFIEWAYGDDMYSEANRLAGSRYHKPGITVPMEHVEEVVDFAEINKFRFSPAAKKLIERAKANKMAAIIADVEVKEKPELPLAGRPTLDIPESVELDDELKD